MPEKQSVPLLGRLAIHYKLITMDQLAEATREQGRRRDDTNLGDILLELDFISREQLSALSRAQKQMAARVRAKTATENAAPEMEPEPDSEAAPPAVEQRALPPARPRDQPMEKATPRVAAPAPPMPAVAPPEPAPVVSPASVAETVPPSAPRESAAARTPASTAQPELQTREPDLAGVTPLAVPTGPDQERFRALLEQCVQQGASDIHIHSGAAVKFRINGELQTHESEVLDKETGERLALCPLDETQRAQFYEYGELDFCCSIEGIGRFRSNVFRQHRGVDAVFRFIPHEPPSLEDLGLPTAIAKFINYHQGMVLCTGPMGCGKSSTLAALVNLINEERKEHILTVEDPIEYLHPSKRCLVNQRSVQNHTESFARALRAALREDPDVIVIGELRDLETISLALSAAETGHLVLATLHTNNSIRTLNRLIGAFPADQQGQIRTMMSESLRAVISQRLIPRADGHGRVAAVERLVITRAVANLIRENKTFQIHSVLQTGASQGMGLLDHSIREHLQAGTITQDDAMRMCDDPKNLA